MTEFMAETGCQFSLLERTRAVTVSPVLAAGGIKTSRFYMTMVHGLEVRVPFVDFALLKRLASAIASPLPPTKPCARLPKISRSKVEPDLQRRYGSGRTPRNQQHNRDCVDGPRKCTDCREGPARKTSHMLRLVSVSYLAGFIVDAYRDLPITHFVFR